MAMHKKLYKNSPEMKRDEESGAMKVEKKGPTEAEKDSARTNDGTEGMKINEGMPPHARQAQERRDMYNRHETEHAMLDNGGGSKTDVYTRHAKEMQDMHKRHGKEADTGSGAGAEKIEKVSEDK